MIILGFVFLSHAPPPPPPHAMVAPSCHPQCCQFSLTTTRISNSFHQIQSMQWSSTGWSDIPTCSSSTTKKILNYVCDMVRYHQLRCQYSFLYEKETNYDLQTLWVGIFNFILFCSTLNMLNYNSYCNTTLLL
jgi:hypothetical protein